MSRNLSPEEKKAWILENCIDEKGDIDLSDLNFSDFDVDVYISGLRVKRNLWQEFQEVGKNLYQGNQKVEKSLHQGYQEVKGNLYQGHQEVKGNLYQGLQEVKGKTYQDKERSNDMSNKENKDLELLKNLKLKINDFGVTQDLVTLGYIITLEISAPIATIKIDYDGEMTCNPIYDVIRRFDLLDDESKEKIVRILGMFSKKIKI